MKGAPYGALFSFMSKQQQRGAVRGILLNIMRARLVAFALACVFLAALPHSVLALTDQEKAALQAQLDQINKDIAANQATLSGLQGEHASLERDISILDSKIKAAQLQIKQSDVRLKQLGAGIAQKNFNRRLTFGAKTNTVYKNSINTRATPWQ